MAAMFSFQEIQMPRNMKKKIETITKSKTKQKKKKKERKNSKRKGKSVEWSA